MALKEVGGMKRYNILLAGVGGQGLLTLGSIIGNAAIVKGLNVTIAETHGMSQRGGSLVVHIRIGNGESPLIPHGATHLLIGMEAIETARYMPFCSRETVVVMNKFLWPPPLAETPDLETLVREVGGRVDELYVVDANSIAIEETGLVVTANTVALGYALAVTSSLRELLGIEVVDKALERVFTGRALELNRKALWRGYRTGLEAIEKR